MEKRPPGRPPAGPGGVKTSTLPVISLRLPPERKALVESLAFMKGVSVAELIDQVVEAYVKTLTPSERRLVKELAQKRR